MGLLVVVEWSTVIDAGAERAGKLLGAGGGNGGLEITWFHGGGGACEVVAWGAGVVVAGGSGEACFLANFSFFLAGDLEFLGGSQSLELSMTKSGRLIGEEALAGGNFRVRRRLLRERVRRSAQSHRIQENLIRDEVVRIRNWYSLSDNCAQ